MGSSGRPKQYLEIAGRTLLEWAIAPLLASSRIERVVIALAPDDDYFSSLPIARDARIQRATGGGERADSVRSGLQALAGHAHEEDFVLVHDAARPCLTSDDLERLMSALEHDEVGGLLATPVVDTLKRSDEQGYVAETVPRQGLWRALTPQMFRFGVLERALREAAERGTTATDESQAVELLGLKPKLVEGSPDNLKITTPPDMAQAQRILASRISS